MIFQSPHREFSVPDVSFSDFVLAGCRERGSPDADAGEVPKAFVVIRGEVDLTELESWVAQQVAPYKRIRRFEVVAKIPRTPSGKILRRVLIEQERAAAGLS